MRTSILRFFHLLVISIFAASTTQAKTIKVFGSDLFKNWLPDACSQSEKAEQLILSFSMTGSYGGLTALQKNYADACLYLQSEDQMPEIPEGFEITTLGYYVIYLHAPEGFPQNKVSDQILSSIANRSEADTTLTWNTLLTESSEWSNQLTQIFVYTGDNDILWSLFRLSFLKEDTYSDRVTVVRDLQSLTDTINRTDYYILASPLANPGSSGLKPVSLIEQGEEVAFPPTVENIVFGDYHARFPIYLIYPSNASWSEDLLGLFQSTELKESFFTHNILPNP